MTMLDVHAEALETSSGPYHEFLLMYRAARPIVYGFVEGREDPSFYRGFIENALPDGWGVRLIRSGTRRAVLDILFSMPWERFSKRRICFFIDRDLWDYVNRAAAPADNLYVTDNYSIENDIVNSHVFERTIEEIFGISNLTEDEREGICNQFETNLRLFCETIAPVMAQILIWRKEDARASLDNIKPQTLFIFKGGTLEIVDTYRSLLSRVGYAANSVGLSVADEEALRATEREFRARSGLPRFVRGKYLLWFLVESAVSLHAAIADYCPRYARPPRVRVTLGTGNAMTILGPTSESA